MLLEKLDQRREAGGEGVDKIRNYRTWEKPVSFFPSLIGA